MKTKSKTRVWRDGINTPKIAPKRKRIAYRATAFDFAKVLGPKLVLRKGY